MTLAIGQDSQPNPFNVLQSRRVEFSDKNLKVDTMVGCVTNNLASRGIAIKPITYRKVPNKLDAGTEDSSQDKEFFYLVQDFIKSEAGYLPSGMGRMRRGFRRN